jgi:hypothetical protein
VAVIAVTGHMNLTEPTVDLVRAAIASHLRCCPAGELVGMSCLARGADTIFAETLIDVGGELIAVLPSGDYRAKKVKPDHAIAFDRLVESAAQVEVMSYETAGRDAYQAANNYLLERATELLAVWDGQPGSGRGGTAEFVVRAKASGLPVTVVWPEGSARS